MANEKTFKYKIVTQVDGSAIKSLEASLKSITMSITTLGNSIKSLNLKIVSNMKSSKDSVDDLTKSFKEMAKTILTVGAAGAVIGKAWDLGKKIIEASRFRQGAVSSLDLFYNGRGSSLFNNVIDISKKTPADTKPLLSGAQRLSGSGLSENQLKKSLLQLADIVSDAGAGESVQDSYLTAVQTLSGGGMPEIGGDLIQKYLGIDRYFRYQAKAAGVKNWETGNIETLKKQVSDARLSGKTTAGQRYTGLEEAILNRQNSKNIGDYSNKMGSSSLEGALSNLSNLFDNILYSVNFEKIPGFKEFVRGIKEVGDTLGSDKVQGIINQFMEKLFSPFKDLKEGDMAKFVEKFIGKLEVVWGWLVKIYEWTKKLLFEDASAALMDVFKASADAFKYLGSLIGDGIKESVVGKDGSIKRFFGFDDDEDQKPGQKGMTSYTPPRPKYQTMSEMMNADHPKDWVMNFYIDGSKDPKETAKEVANQKNTAVDKLQSKKNARKAGLSD